MAKGPHGGAIAWKTLIPKIPTDSTGHAELVLCTSALKIVSAVRTLLTELNVGVAPAGPTDFYTDAQAVVEGAALERLSRFSRWLASRYAMMRWGVDNRVIALCKKAAADNTGDLTTKPVCGTLFFRLRSRLMGQAPGSPYYVE
jgi:hypothetical protein